MTMTRKLFTEEEIEILKKNKYVGNVTEKAITYTAEFKEEYIGLILTGNNRSEAIRKLGFDPKILGRERVRSLNRRMKRKIRNGETYEDKRTTNSGRRKTKNLEDMTEIEQIEYLKHENLVLKAENDLLKKMGSLVKKKQLKKLRQKNDIN